jgi:hypothetical protein
LSEYKPQAAPNPSTPRACDDSTSTAWVPGVSSSALLGATSSVRSQSDHARDFRPRQLKMWSNEWWFEQIVCI